MATIPPLGHPFFRCPLPNVLGSMGCTRPRRIYQKVNQWWDLALPDLATDAPIDTAQHTAKLVNRVNRFVATDAAELAKLPPDPKFNLIKLNAI